MKTISKETQEKVEKYLRDFFSGDFCKSRFSNKNLED
jgi:hypothetical protein